MERRNFLAAIGGLLGLGAVAKAAEPKVGRKASAERVILTGEVNPIVTGKIDDQSQYKAAIRAWERGWTTPNEVCEALDLTPFVTTITPVG